MKDYINTAKIIVNTLGGSKNIRSLTHCMTRLRFDLIDDTQINDKEVKEIANVLGVVRKGGQYQVIIGNDVAICFKEVMNLIDVSEEQSATTKKKFSIKGWGSSILDAISGSIAPIIPVILGCGMVKILIIILDLMGVSSATSTYRIVTIIGDVGYYFLPILLAYSASKKFKCNTPLAMTLVAILLHPELIAILAKGNSSFLNVQITSASYASTVIPALLSVWLLSKVEPITDKLFTSWRRTLLKPLVILLVCIPIILIVLAPLGMLIGNGMASVLSFMYTKVGWLTIGLYSALLPFVVMAGMHVAVFPYIFSNLESLGYDFLQLPAMLAYNFSQAAAAAAVAVKSKDKELKATATAAAISACVGGITEPALYGVNLRLKKPLIASMIGSGISGLLIGFLGIKAFAFSGPCLLSFPMFASNTFIQNFLFACIAGIVSVVVTFVLTLLFGWEEEKENDLNHKDIEDISVVSSPLSGTLIALQDIQDEAFSSESLGKGVCIKPSVGQIIAPFDGTVVALFPTKHAIGIKNNDGTIEMLIHVGIDTVELNGKGFENKVEVKDSFKKGDTLLTFDILYITNAGYDTITPIIITNTNAYNSICVVATDHIEVSDAMLSLKK
ncbi:beta-glucoside-specific PTS transporter subunit IIABC [Amedibacillus sp. YH-ame6]